MRKVLDAALPRLKTTGPPNAVEKNDLAERLRKGEEEQSLSALVENAHRVASHDTRIDHFLARLQMLQGAPLSQELQQKIDQIDSEQDRSRRALLTDSLVIELSSYINLEKRLRQVRRELRELRYSLDGDTPEERALLARIDTAVEQGSETEITLLLTDVRRFLAGMTKRKQAAARRNAVLTGLAALGYEVRETMNAAWVRDGRIVVKRPGIQDYGIELGATADAEQMQVRVVGATVPRERRTPERDRDMEVRWCNDFSALSGALAESGISVELEHALDPGAVPVRTVAMETAASTEEQRRRETGTLRAREN
jgi:hypothetical protein